MKQIKIPTIIKDNVVPTVIIGGAAYFLLVRPFLIKLGVIKSNAQKQIDNASVLIDAYNPNYLSSHSNVTISQATADNAASTIYYAFGVIADDFSAALGAFKLCKTKADVAFLSKTFFNKYNVDLYTYLQTGGGLFPWDGFSSAHLEQLNQYVNSLPE